MNEHEERPGSLPKARVEKNWRRYLFWLIPVLAAVIAGFIIYHEVIKKGPTLHIYFDNAAGIQGGKSKMKFRGVEVGNVEAVELSRDNKQVKVTVSLESSAGNLAREGSKFWIVKPEIGLNKFTRLQTIMGGDYLTVQPGGGKRRTEFRGIPEAPATEKEEPGRRVILLGEKLGSIRQYSPVLYHGVQVGEVHDFSLGPTAQTVRVFVNIQRKYTPLVRMNSKFWHAGGLNVNIGFSGIDISAQSASTLLTGGIDLATPDSKAQEAYDGAAFRLYAKPESPWLGWFPQIDLPLVGGPNPTAGGLRKVVTR
jgi:paraquat-inducible protein B